MRKLCQNRLTVEYGRRKANGFNGCRGLRGSLNVVVGDGVVVRRWYSHGRERFMADCTCTL